MDSEFEFLRRFESELSMRAKADARREASPKPKYPRRWKPLVAVAAMLLVLAAGIGILANSGLSGSEASMAASGAMQGSERNPGGLAPALPAPAVAPGTAHANQGGVGFAPTRQNGYVAGSVNDTGSTTGTSQPNIQQGRPTGSTNAATTDLSKIIRDGQIAVTIDDGTFKAKAGSVAHIAAVNGGSILSSS